jgi:hypothetical protein
MNKLPAPEADTCLTAKGRPGKRGGHEGKEDTTWYAGTTEKDSVGGRASGVGALTGST